ncbi:lysophospholipid acyltransferase family protein [Jannaschia pohangensis]|uniref:KDO2-lipid IV(A) lauroyltransferase n=1 Tax=Jannaschia pohangensis TaxID=390807 RepID=A0A1I3T8T6_9RHOB|nr:lysophospholipid acyltransferase family protein [Jannaschia pohangensis]SFJ67010.1 KDO2-lipid IV(A) lauroyltransferase [Jannaschia pohangensis]
MRRTIYWIQGAFLRCLLALARLMPLAWRRAIIGQVSAAVVRLTPLRRRILDNLDLVFPDMSNSDRTAMVQAVGRNVGRSLTGIWFNADFARSLANQPAEGPGLAALRDAHAAGRGAIIVSGHFGQWEAIRHILRREGMETGAIYRPNNNPYYEPIFRDGIELGGQPIIPKGRAGYRQMLAHIRDGGFMALLPDQAADDGVLIPFLGHPAMTSLGAAELALRYDLLLVPAFAPEEDGALRIIFEDPIPHSDAQTMMAAYNARLGSWVTRYPSQWHWLHRRWKRYPER